MSAVELIQHFVGTISLGSIYALVALGLAIVFSVLNLVNFAHGELLTVAAYSMVWVTAATLPWELAVLVAMGTAVAIALLLERVAFRPVRGAGAMTLLLTSFALSLMIQNLLLMVAGPLPKEIVYSGWTRASLTLGGIVLEWMDVVTLVVTVLSLGTLNYVLRATLLGISLRAAAEDFTTTRLMGIRAELVTIGAFAVSGALAGLAAVFWFANSSVVLPASGFTPVLKGFICAVIGGFGSLTGAVLAGYLLAATEGVFQILLTSEYQPYGEAFVFSVVIVFLAFRPQGILGQPERGL